MGLTQHHTQFITATILQWKHLLKQDCYKNIIIDSLKFLVNQKRVKVYAFVIMTNHIHLIWQIQHGNTKEAVQRDILKFTAQQIKFELHKNNPKLLEEFKVNTKDRQYQFWKRNSLKIDLWSIPVLLQKMNYVHQNPVKAGLCKLPEEYYYSSANFYNNGVDKFNFLTHINE